MMTCKKCEGLTAAFGWNGNVKVADEAGKILYEGANDSFYSDLYKDGNPLEWPVCPECGRSLDIHAAEELEGSSGWMVVLGVALFCAAIWAAVIWAVFQIG